MNYLRCGLAKTSILAALLLVVVALAVSVPSAEAIHEDEQGLRDWIVRLVGDVEHAATSPVSADNIFVASRDAVAAFRVFGQGNMTWRETLSEAPKCLIATRSSVITVGANGTVLSLNPSTGLIDTTYVLKDTPTVQQASCVAVAGGDVRIAVHDGTALKLFVLEAGTESEELAASKSFPLDVSQKVLSVRVSATSIVANLKGSKSLVFAGDVESGAQNEGWTADVTAGGDGSVLRSSESSVKTVIKGRSTDVSCVKCDAHIVRDLENGAALGAVTVDASDSAVTATFQASGKKVTIPKQASAFAPVVLHAFAVEDVSYALVKSGNRDVALVSEDSGVLWERREGLGLGAVANIVDPSGPLDYFHFNKVMLVVSRFGSIYSVSLLHHGRYEQVADISLDVQKAFGVSCPCAVHYVAVEKETPSTILVLATHKTRSLVLRVDLATRAVTSSQIFDDALYVSAQFQLRKDHTISGALPAQQLFTYILDEETNTLQGYRLSNATKKMDPTWRLGLPSKVVAHAFGGSDPSRIAVSNDLVVYTNQTTEKVEEVRHRYPTRNVVVVAYYEQLEGELPALVIVAVDSVTGSVLATTRHRDVLGPVRLLVAEHTVIYHFLDAAKMRYCFGVWEIFEQESGGVVTTSNGATLPQVIASFFVSSGRTFSSRATRSPVVAAATLGIQGGPVAALGLTTSHHSIARKNVVVVFETGRVAVIELRALLSGQQMPMTEKSDTRITHVLIPSFMLATHKHRVAAPRLVLTSPTRLESSSHVAVVGLDVFYVRSSSGKPFDLLNSDFNKPLLISLAVGFFVTSLIAKQLVARKAVNAMWK